MDKHNVLASLKVDQPRFHFLSDDGVRKVAQAGISTASGECSWAVTPGILRWIADHLTEDMITIETGAGYTTVLFAALARHHYCCTPSQREADKIRSYLEEQLEIATDKLTFLIGPSDETLPQLKIEQLFDFAYIDGCHGYPFPALDWHYIDKKLKVGGLIGMDNVELRPVREHCEFLEENGGYRLVDVLVEGYFVRFYEKLMDQPREWIEQRYSLAKHDPCNGRPLTLLRRKASKLIKPYLY